MDTHYIIVHGSPINGFHFCGPFPNVTYANEYAKEYAKEGQRWWIAEIVPPIHADPHSILLENLALSVRAASSLHNDNRLTLGDFINMSDRELSALPGMGPTTVKEIRDLIIRFRANTALE
jgi:DNA-directed RNA polymerase alpha subunit